MNNRVRYYAGRYYCIKCKKYYWDAQQAINCKHTKDKTKDIFQYENDEEDDEDDNE